MKDGKKAMHNPKLDESLRKYYIINYMNWDH